MCGIAGYFGDKTLQDSHIKDCLELMGRRGPDASSSNKWVNSVGKKVYLIHSRLKIIDMRSSANQPLDSDDQYIVFNGELYNYIELRKKLTSSGVNFKTNSDTEVLLKALTNWGTEGLDYCEGMWAFALFNKNDGSLTLSRDRFGEKPLYIYKDNEGTYFGSEVKFILALLGKKLELNKDQMHRFLINGFKSVYKVNDTFYKGIYELKPATSLRILSNGAEKNTTFWKPKFCPNNDMTYNEAVEGVRERLLKSLEIRLRADVPLAFCMSGGVDSNILISIAKKIFGYDVHGFTAVDNDERYNELEYVNDAVKELSISHSSVNIDSTDFLSGLRTLTQQHDGPVLTSSYYAHWLLQKSISSNGYKVAISGTGADELFSGYYEHFLAYQYQVRDDKNLYDKSLKDWGKYVEPIVRNPYLKDQNTFLKNPGQRDYIYLNADKFKKYLNFEWHENFIEKNYTDDLLRNRMLNEMFFEIVPQILHQDDLNSMFYSMENRSPYLDRNLFEFSNQIPTKYLIKNGYSKIILRDAFRDITPKSILNNHKKVGFNASINSLINLKDRKQRNDILKDSPIFDFVNRDNIEKLMNKEAMPNSESKLLFNFISLKIFMENYL